MKTKVEILGGAQILLAAIFDIQDCFEEYLTKGHRAFLQMLRVIESFFPKIEQSIGIRGRRPFENLPFLRAYLAKPKRKRGRPRKGELRPKAPSSRLTRQISMPSGKAFGELNRKCAWGCKKNSQGNIQFWKGYKLHLDVTDMGIPTAALVTGANVHDSQVSLPLEKLTERNLTYLYSVMDAANDAPQIHHYSEEQGRIALIDRNKRRGDTGPPMNHAERERFKVCSTVKRANAHLKDWFWPSKIMVRGYSKVNFTLMAGVLCLAAVKILQNFVLPVLDSTA